MKISIDAKGHSSFYIFCCFIVHLKLVNFVSKNKNKIKIKKLIHFIMHNMKNIHMLVYAKYVIIYIQYKMQYTLDT